MGPKRQLNASDSTGKDLMSVKVRNDSWDIEGYEMNLIHELLHWAALLAVGVRHFLATVIGWKTPLFPGKSTAENAQHS